jgi:hypothetical protein
MGARGFPRMTQGNPPHITPEMRESFRLNREGLSHRKIAYLYGVAFARMQEWIARVKDEENRRKL